MTLNLLANIDPVDVQTFVDEVPFPSDYLFTAPDSIVLPSVQVQSVKYRIRRTTRFQSVAQFRAFDTETPRGRREVTHAITEGILPPLGQKLDVGELQTILLDMERGADDQELIDALYDDFGNHVRAIRGRLELAAGDLLTDGTFSLVDENGLTLTANYAWDAAFLPVASPLWTSTATAHPIDDELAWMKIMAEQGEGRAVRGYTAQQNLDILGSIKQYQEEFYHQGLSSYPTLTPAQVNAVRAGRQLPPLFAYDTQVRVAGVNQRTFPADRVLYVPADNVGETQMGITAEKIALSRNGNPRIAREDLPGIVITVSENDDPVFVRSKGTAVAMPLSFTPKGFLVARVR